MQTINYANRGKWLEMVIERSNTVYKNKGVALVNKIPTNWIVHYDKNKRASKAIPEKKGTVDFIGVSQGRSIAFDAKSTKERKRFPLDNVHTHQVEYLIKHQEQGGISFFIVYFEKHNEFYYLPLNEFLKWWEEAKKGGRKSIPYEWFVENAEKIKTRNGIPLDYLSHTGVFKGGLKR